MMPHANSTNASPSTSRRLPSAKSTTRLVVPTEHFKSKEAYRKNMAYRHMNDIPFTAVDVVVGGKEHKVKHSGGARARIDAKQRRKAGMGKLSDLRRA